MYLGEIIYDYRMKHKLTLKQFSELSGLSVAYLSQLENNRNPKTGRPATPSPQTFLKAANAMMMNIDELFHMVDQNQPVCVNSSSSDTSLPKDVEILLDYYEAMNEEGKTKVIEYARDLVSSKQYIKTYPDKLVD